MGKKEDLKKGLFQVWKRTKRDLEAVAIETNRLLRRGERQVKQISEKSKKKLELMNLKLKRQKIYYELGKSIVDIPVSRWQKSRKVKGLYSEIKKLNREIKKINR